MYKELKSPVAVQLELTTGCNHKCVHCYNHWRKSSEKDRTLSVAEIKRIIENLKNSEVPDLLITGGEPMLYPDLMITAFEFARSVGLECSLNSNLTLVTPEIARELKRLRIGVLTSILSFERSVHDSITTVTGSFDRLIDGIRLVQEYGVSVSANMVVMRMNMDQIYETGRFIHGLGITGFRATKVHPAQGSQCFEKIKLPPERIAVIFDTLIRLKEELGLKVDSLTTYPMCLLKDMSRYGQFLSKRNCSAGKTGCTIGADGQVRPCGHSDNTYGNAIEESLLQIWPRLNEWRDGSLLPQECKECKHVVRCGGGCRMDCKFYGKINGMDPYATGKDFALIPQKLEPVALLDAEMKLEVNANLHFREEKFGTALVVEGSFKSVITQDSTKMLKELIGTTFTPNSIASKYDLEVDFVRRFFTGLHKQKAVIVAH